MFLRQMYSGTVIKLLSSVANRERKVEGPAAEVGAPAEDASGKQLFPSDTQLDGECHCRKLADFTQIPGRSISDQGCLGW